MTRRDRKSTTAAALGRQREVQEADDAVGRHTHTHLPSPAAPARHPRTLASSFLLAFSLSLPPNSQHGRRQGTSPAAAFVTPPLASQANALTCARPSARQTFLNKHDKEATTEVISEMGQAVTQETVIEHVHNEEAVAIDRERHIVRPAEL
jgi:hypothetical protein